MKRAQNAGIALARIKMSFEEIKNKITSMNDEGLSTEQLKSLEVYCYYYFWSCCCIVSVLFVLFTCFRFC